MPESLEAGNKFYFFVPGGRLKHAGFKKAWALGYLASQSIQIACFLKRLRLVRRKRYNDCVHEYPAGNHINDAIAGAVVYTNAVVIWAAIDFFKPHLDLSDAFGRVIAQNGVFAIALQISNAWRASPPGTDLLHSSMPRLSHVAEPS